MSNIFKLVLNIFGYTPIALEILKVIFNTIRRAKRMSDESNKVDVKAMADKIIADLKTAAGEVKELKGLKISEIIRNVPDVVHAVENLAKDVKMSGDQKKDVVIEILNRFIDIPLVPESAEAILIGFVVDAVVAAFNKYGHDWITKL